MTRGGTTATVILQTIDPAIRPGTAVTLGQKIGVLGKEGASGGWSHLHFEIVSRQPSGKWGTQEGYAFLWEAALRQAAARGRGRRPAACRVLHRRACDARRLAFVEPIGHDCRITIGLSMTGTTASGRRSTEPTLAGRIQRDPQGDRRPREHRL